MWLINSMLKIDTKLIWDTKKLKTINVENDERRIKFVELFKIEVIDENVNSRSRKFKTKN